ncbi:hypothetical protein N7450_008818 [Penicillium hetheringtonii]|uniref:SUI1 domain-containing protein n=1 Tax=Penicillium hetheringtonii TaxID=911720 RepID=A0AAD6GQ35_9EURO|nr:hypothetical protein N7450_008818 [Penicillium hetheringtonii]
MFKKKPTVKNLSPLRSSDRRKIADQIISDYKISIPSSPAEASSDQAAKSTTPTPNLSSVRNALLPENSLTARFTTTAGPDLREVQGIVYVGAHPEKMNALYPMAEPRYCALTTYSRYGNAQTTRRSGSHDPGLANDPPFDPRAVKGSPVAVATINSHTVPLFVGICEIDVSALGEVQGTKGHAIRGLHWQGDELWAWSSSSRPGRPAPEYLEGWDEEETEEVEEGVAGITLDESADTAANENADDIVDESSVPDPETAPDFKEPTTKEIDDAFINAFIYSLYKLKHDNPSATNHGLTLPVSPSMLIANLITPYLPIYHPQQAQHYNIKKTSWKNVKKFIKHLDKLQLVKSKDRSGQETVVLDVDFDDHRVERFVPYRLASRSALDNASKPAASEAKKSTANGDSDPAVGQTLTVQTLYRPTGKLAPTIFPALSANDPKNFYKFSEVSTHLDQYLQSQDPPVISRENRRIITLTPFLAETVFASSSSEDQGTLKRGKTTRDGLLKRIQEDRTLLQPHYAILKPGQTLAEVKPKSGATPKALVTIEKRTGSKTMTKVTNLEIFGIIPGLLAEELQKKCASSTSVTQATGAAKGIMEVLVQGDQRKAVDTALVRRGLKSQWIDLVDKTKKKK